MGKVLVDLSMSLDGFITGPHPDSKNGLGSGDGMSLHKWYFSGKKPGQYSDMFTPEGKNRAVVDEMFETTGAMVVGRKWYDMVNGWDGNHPIQGVPIFVVTHKPPDKVPQGKSKFVFVTDGIESVIKQAKKAAGDKNVTVGGANVARQVLKAGLLDAVYIHLAPILLGAGTRLFEGQEVHLKATSVVKAPHVTHLQFDVVK